MSTEDNASSSRPEGTQVYLPQGALALPRPGKWCGYGEAYEAADQSVSRREDIAVVVVSGPLMNGDSWWWDTYQGIQERVGQCMAEGFKAVILSIYSPGGVVAGCMETARGLRAMSLETGVPLYAYVNGQATSAAYALASAASFIMAPPTAIVGSIGVISQLVDTTAMDAKIGLRFVFVVSGAKKALGAVGTAIDEDTIAEEQKLVDELAGEFHALVSEHRGLSVEAIAAQEAGVVTGRGAHALGLVDAVGDFRALLARIETGAMEPDPADPTGPDEQENDDMEQTEIEARVAAILTLETNEEVLAWLEEHGDELAEKVAEINADAEDDGGEGEGEGDGGGEATSRKGAVSAETRTGPYAHLDRGALEARLAIVEGSKAATAAAAKAAEEAAVEADVERFIASGRSLGVSKEKLKKLRRQDPDFFAASMAGAPVVVPKRQTTNKSTEGVQRSHEEQVADLNPDQQARYQQAVKIHGDKDKALARAQGIRD